MSRKESCENTDYTSGFKVHHEKDGSFVAIKGDHKLHANSAKELNEMIENFRGPQNTKAKKKPAEQKAHDTCVRTIAEDLQKDNWLVKANSVGWEKPSEIGGKVPDLMAHKGCLKRICQIVTEKDFEGDKANYRDFKNYCREYDFQLYVIDKNGKPKPMDI
jgi:hypothetical protein